MKRRFAGDQWHSIGPSQPSFKIIHEEKMNRSTPIVTPGRALQIILRGKFDSVLMFKDSRIVVCDFKTSPVKPEYVEKYWVQLHAYAHALEHPALGSLAIPKVHGLGLAVFEPAVFEHDEFNGAALSGAFNGLKYPETMIPRRCRRGAGTG
jgi:PD-(D/E)XK nuclease superfamily